MKRGQISQIDTNKKDGIYIYWMNIIIYVPYPHIVTCLTMDKINNNHTYSPCSIDSINIF